MWNSKRLLRFAKRFGQNPMSASHDLASYLFLKLPPFMQSWLKVFSRWSPKSPTGTPASASDKPHDLVTDIVNKFHVSETFVKLYREQGHGPIDWSKPDWQDFFENTTSEHSVPMGGFLKKTKNKYQLPRGLGRHRNADDEKTTALIQ